MNARRNEHKERITSVAVSSAYMGKMLMDGRTGLKAGTIAEACGQRGVSCKDNGKYVVLSAPRDRLQLIVELLYFSCVPHKIVG